MASTASPARAAAPKSSASATRRMRPTIARPARPAGACWPTAPYRACCAKTGRAPSTNWRPSRAARRPASPRSPVRDSISPMADRTVFRVLEEAAELYGNAPALHQPQTVAGKRQVRTLSWIEYRTAAEEIAAGLRTLGIRKGDIVALDSETRLEFYLADLGIMANGSIAAAVYPSYPPKELVRILQACDAKAVFVEDPKTLENLKGASVAKWILLTGEAPGAITLEELRRCGREAMARDPILLPAMR